MKIQRRWWAFLLAAFLTVSLAGAAVAAEFGGGEVYRLPAGETLDDDLYVSGGEIYIDGTVTGDLYAAGGYIEINGEVKGDVVAAGGGIVINGAVGDDLRAAGGGLDIAGTVGDDMIVAGGGGRGFAFPMQFGSRSIQQGIRVARSAQIGGDAVVAGGGARIAGTIGGDFLGSVGDLDLLGQIGGNAKIDAKNLRIDEGASVEGALTYSTPEQADVPAGVAGEVRFEPPQPQEKEQANIVGSLIRWILRTLAILIGMTVLGWLFLRWAPGVLTQSAAAIQAKPVETGVYGLVAAVAFLFVPLASIVLVVFVWAFWGVFPGIVMLLFLLATLALLWVFSPLITGLWLGQRIRDRLGGSTGLLATLLIGVLFIVVLGRIPFLGWLVYLLSFVLALGALIRSGREEAGEGATQLTEAAV